MAHPVFCLKFGEEFVGLFLRDVWRRGSTIGGDQVELTLVRFNILGHVLTAALLKGLENADFIGKALFLVRAAEVFVYVAVVVDFDQRADAVLEISHDVGFEIGEVLVAPVYWLILKPSQTASRQPMTDAVMLRMASSGEEEKSF